MLGAENTFNSFQLDIPVLMPIVVLLVMGFLSSLFSLSLHLKSRIIRKLPKDLPVTVFSKTFNVFDPHPSRRKIIQDSALAATAIGLLFALSFAFFSAAKILETGSLLGLIIFIICINLMMLEENFEIHKNASIFVRAIQKEYGLGQGDLAVFSKVKEAVSRLKTYYLSLAIMFFASSLILPYALPVAMSFLARFVEALIQLTAFEGTVAPYFAVFLFAGAFLIFDITAGKVKAMIFGFPPSESLVSLNKPFEAMKQWVKWHPHELLHRPPPEPDDMPDSEREKS